MTYPNVAVVGCGAITQSFYLPALKWCRSRIGELWLVDPSRRALSVASSILPGKEVGSLSEVTGDLQCVIVATPNELHYPLAVESLARGANVLIEKPFAIWPTEARRLVQLADTARLTIAVNQTRRFHPLARDLRKRIANAEFGPLRCIEHKEGTKLAWPFESGAAFEPMAQRTGVIMDFGVHVIDFYHYLLGPKWEVAHAIHDGFHGPEGLAHIALRASGAPVRLELSRYYLQTNTARLEFEHAEVSFDVYGSSDYMVRWRSDRSSHSTYHKGREGAGSPAHVLILNFLAACAGTEAPVCTAASSLPVIDILDQIYRRAERYPARLGAV